MIIREAKTDDVRSIARLQQEFVKEHAKLYDPIFYKLSDSANTEWVSWALKKLESEELILFLAENECVIVGYVSGWIETRSPIYALNKIGFLSNIYVAPEYRGKGIARLLNVELLLWFKKQGMEYVELFVDSRASAAVSAWSKLGYQEVGKRMRIKFE